MNTLCFLFFYVFAMFLFLYKAIKNTDLYRNIQLLIFYSFIFLEYIFSVHRQGVAMCIIYYAITLIHEDKLFRYTLLVILASLFHKIAIILIPLYFFIRKEFKVSVLFYMVVIALFISSFDLIGIVIKWCNENFSNVGVLANRVSGILLVSYAIFFSVLICNLKFKRNRLLIILYMFFLT